MKARLNQNPTRCSTRHAKPCGGGVFFSRWPFLHPPPPPARRMTHGGICRSVGEFGKPPDVTRRAQPGRRRHSPRPKRESDGRRQRCRSFVLRGSCRLPPSCSRGIDGNGGVNERCFYATEKCSFFLSPPHECRQPSKAWRGGGELSVASPHPRRPSPRRRQIDRDDERG